MTQNTKGLRIAHLSDPHFSKITLNPNQFLSKRWMGNFNLILFRNQAYQTKHLWHLPELFETLEVDSAFITGDFSSTSLDEEFLEGKEFVNAFKNRGINTFTLPGNHDCYTKKAQKENSFFRYFPSRNLKEKKVECHKLKKGWWYIGLNCAIPTPFFCAYGLFSQQMEEELEKNLFTIPKHENVIIGNHFPLFPANRPKHNLKRAHQLQILIKKYPQIKLYLHGHDHKPYIIDRPQEGFPLVLNSGSCAHKPDGTFYLIDLFETECLIQKLLFRKTRGDFSWVIDWQKHFTFRP